MKYFFRGLEILNFDKNPGGRIYGTNGEKYLLEVTPNFDNCNFIADDVHQFNLFFKTCTNILNGTLKIEECEDIEVY